MQDEYLHLPQVVGMPAPLVCVGQGEQASFPTIRAFTQRRGNLRVTPALCVTSRSTCLKTNTKNGKPRPGQLTEHTRQKHWRWHLCYRSIHPSVTHTCSLFPHSITVCRHVEFELAKQGQEESPAEALWWASEGLIRWKVPPWKWAKLFLVFHLSFSSECGWQLHCPFASHRLYSVATQSAAQNKAQIRNKAIIKTQRKFQKSYIFQLCKTQHAAKSFLYNFLITRDLLFMWYFQLLWAFWAEVS